MKSGSGFPAGNCWLVGLSCLPSNRLLLEEINSLLYNLLHKVMFVAFPVLDFRRDPAGCMQGSVWEEGERRAGSALVPGRIVEQSCFHGFRNRRTYKLRGVGKGFGELHQLTQGTTIGSTSLSYRWRCVGRPEIWNLEKGGGLQLQHIIQWAQYLQGKKAGEEAVLRYHQLETGFVGISLGKWRLSPQWLWSGISEVSTSRGTKRYTARFFADCVTAEWETHPGMAEGKENLCFVLIPALTLSGTCPATTSLLGTLKEVSFPRPCWA